VWRRRAFTCRSAFTAPLTTSFSPPQKKCKTLLWKNQFKKSATMILNSYFDHHQYNFV